MIETEKELTTRICAYIKYQYPDVIFTVDASGLRLTIGQSIQLKRMRSTRGLPDLMIFEPRGIYHGLFIELKREGTRLKKKDGSTATEHIKEQAEVITNLLRRQYLAGFAVGFDQARDIINSYMKLGNK